MTAQMAAAAEQANWSTLPPDLSDIIFWHDSLGLSDLLRCQIVCRRWRDLLKQRSVHVASGDLTHKLLIEFPQRHWAGRGHDICSALRLQQEPPHILVHGVDEEPESAQGEAYFSCRRWLVRTADLLHKVQLSGREPTDWQLRDILGLPSG